MVRMDKPRGVESSLSKTEQPAQWRRPRNARAWAIGRETRTGFQVRRIVWGRLAARFEKREDESIRAAFITVAPRPKKRKRNDARHAPHNPRHQQPVA
jgi:hypothetical protein